MKKGRKGRRVNKGKKSLRKNMKRISFKKVVVLVVREQKRG